MSKYAKIINHDLLSGPVFLPLKGLWCLKNWKGIEFFESEQAAFAEMILRMNDRFSMTDAYRQWRSSEHKSNSLTESARKYHNKMKEK